MNYVFMWWMGLRDEETIGTRRLGLIEELHIVGVSTTCDSWVAC